MDSQRELEYKPKEILFARGDGGVYINEIAWSKWNMTGTLGADGGPVMMTYSKWVLDNPISD